MKYSYLQNISGTLTAVLAIISIASTPNPRTSAIYYFIAAIFVLLVAFDTYFALPLIVSIFNPSKCSWDIVFKVLNRVWNDLWSQ